MKMTLPASIGTIYTLTADPQNGSQAMDLGFVHGLRVDVLFPKDLPLPPDALALIIDRDSLALDARDWRQWLAEKVTNPPTAPTFVYSYCFDEEAYSTPGGVVLVRRLDDLLRRLAEHLELAASQTSDVGADSEVVPAQSP